MPLSPETYRRLAADLGYQQDALEKVLRLGELLDQIGGHHRLQSDLTLRGGTALNLMHSSPPRLSVDLDFDFIGAIEREKMLELKPMVTSAVGQIGRALGYQVGARTAEAGSSLRFRYQNSRGTQDEVKVDISWTNRVQIGSPSRKALWQPDPIARPTLLVSSDQDLVGGKFRALIDRVAARDVFDAVQLAEFHSDWPSAFRSAFVFLTGTLALPLTSYTVDRLDSLSEVEAERNLRPMIRTGLKVDAATLKMKAKDALTPLLELTSVEREFVDRLHVGDLCPELIFRSDDADRLRMHPHLLWKVQNVRSHLKK